MLLDFQKLQCIKVTRFLYTIFKPYFKGYKTKFLNGILHNVNKIFV